MRYAINNVGDGETNTFNADYTITLASELLIEKSLTITGNGAGSTIIQANASANTANYRVFHVNAPDKNVTLSGMTIRNGNATENGGGGIFVENCTLTTIENCIISDNVSSNNGGGGISANEPITVSNCTVEDNTVTSGSGGGIYAKNCALATIENTTISGNNITATNEGGGIHADDSSIKVSNCTVSYNSGNHGGGISFSNEIFGTSMDIKNTSISNNTVVHWGGGIYISLAHTTGEINIESSTISNNSGFYGGGFFVTSTVSGSTANFVNLTISNNNASEAGGGILLKDNLATSFQNCIIANNQNNQIYKDYYHYGSCSVDDNGYNVIGYSNVGASETGGFNNATSILYNTKYNTNDTNLTTWSQGSTDHGDWSLNLSDTLAENGGPTQTLALGTDSFAAASATTGIPYGSSPYWNDSPEIDSAYTDQRGVVRTANQNTSIGAYSTNYLSLPTVTTQAVTVIGTTTATGNGGISDLGSPDPTQHGVCWNTTGTPTIADSKTQEGAATLAGAFTSEMTGLLPGTTYYVRAYATNTAGTAYGDEVSFTTNASGHLIGVDFGLSDQTVPTNWRSVTPDELGNYATEATIDDLGTETGGSTGVGLVLKRVVGAYPRSMFYNASVNAGTVPIHGNSLTNIWGNFYGFSNGTNPAKLELTITGLEAERSYDIWVFGLRTGGDVNQAVSIQGAGVATTFNQVATSGNLVVNDTQGNSATDLTTYKKSIVASAGGEIVITVTADSSSTSAMYTLAGVAIDVPTPTVTTQAVTDIDTTTATGNGTVTALGDPNPTQHGVCWNTTGNPTIADSKTTEGAVSATSAFTSDMTGLSGGTTYHVRSYATNEVGTEYGSDVSFKTTSAQVAPTVTTQAVTGIGSSSATGNGNITDLGIPTPTTHGVCWSTNADPTIDDVNDDKIDNGAAGSTGAFTASITGLSSGTTYHVRAYAANTAGTAYGDDVTFTSICAAPVASSATNVGATSFTANWTSVTGAQSYRLDVSISNTFDSFVSGYEDKEASSATSAGVTGLSAAGTYYFRVRAVNVDSTASASSNIKPVTTASSPEMDVKGNSISIADGDTTPSLSDHTDFGGINVDSGTISRTFTIENTGTADLTLSGTPKVAISGHTTDFSVKTQPASGTVAASGSTTFTVTFDPTTTGARNAIISIANNDSDENPYNFSIQGNGTAPEINIKQGTTDIADSESYDFSNQGVGSDTDIVFTIQNTGNAELTLSTSLSITGANADQFNIQAQPSSPVAGSGSTTFTVRFSPTSAGTKTATISITNDDADENPYNLTVQGSGDDNDGVDNTVEDGVPSPDGGTGDGNGDGEDDSGQANVSSLPTYDDADYATLDCTTTAGTTLENVTASPPGAAGVPTEINMPFGVFSFEVHGVTSGQTVTMDIFVPRNETITGYFKENKDTGVWKDIATAVDSTSVNRKTKISIQLTEDGPYDTDSLASTITDPGGPGSQSSESIPTLDEWGMIIFSGLLLLGSIVMIRRRQGAM